MSKLAEDIFPFVNNPDPKRLLLLDIDELHKCRVAEGIKCFPDLPLLFSHPKTLAAGIYS